MATSHMTIDHDEIRKWAEARKGKPSRVAGTERGGDDAGLIRLDFPGYAEDKLEEIPWDDWFEKFEEGKLELIIQEKTADGKTSHFNKIVKREEHK